MHLTNWDLCQKQYTLEELEENLGYLDLRVVLARQKLTADFCVKHLLSAQMPDVSYEEWDAMYDYNILCKQKHLTEADLESARERARAEAATTSAADDCGARSE